VEGFCTSGEMSLIPSDALRSESAGEQRFQHADGAEKVTEIEFLTTRVKKFR
jgi:hypothetical protein